MYKILKKCSNIRKLEIPEIILNNVFLCKNFRFNFVMIIKLLLTKKY